jgi:lipopolysaccharide/colanic/teichoic acid biosynthesis glycosyltransferase/ubiquinone/menaquinone biosynthesis C-methylase UbiE
MLKRTLDIGISGAALTASAPAMAVIWWAIRRERDGPVLYRGTRAGLDGRPFQMYKFRTMVSNAETMGGPSTADDDARITRIGRRLRRYKLDELPQLFNVLRGDMSLVGPRPQVLSEVAGYTEEELELLRARPGITDWASILYSNEGEILAAHDDPDAAYAELIRPEKMRLSLEYVRHATLLDDARILYRTLAVPFRKRPDDYVSVTEAWGSAASPEQVAMAYLRYHLAGLLATGKRVLEVGCGTGMGLAYLSRRAARVVGCDVSETLLAEAREHLPAVDLVQASAGSLPFDDGSFDVVLMLEMLYYVDDQPAAMAEAVRVLTPGGSVMVCAPNPTRPGFNPSPFSHAYPDVQGLAQLLAAQGLEVSVFGAFRVIPAGSRESLVETARKVAVRLHLVPRSMRVKAWVKRLLYGPRQRLGEVHEGMAELAELVPLDAATPTPAFKNIYAMGRKA